MHIVRQDWPFILSLSLKEFTCNMITKQRGYIIWETSLIKNFQEY